ncbi:AAA family ATPase [Bradyrhizobium elkanii]
MAQAFHFPRDLKAMTDEDWRTLRGEAEILFTPGTAIKEQELFAGRKEQIAKLAQRIRLSGGHAVIYGERGVGKSSLVNIFRYVADASPSRVQYIRVAATDGDDYHALFVKIFKRMTLEENGTRTRLADLYENRQITPDDVLLEFENFSNATTPIIVIDEFDRLKDERAKILVSDTIKLISDEAVNATFFIVGVSDAVEELLHGHESIGRALSQVEMPRMSDGEIIDIINRRLKRAGIRIKSDAIWDCVFICKGLPHYAHLLGLHAMQAVCDRRSLTIERSDINEASKRALLDANQSIKSGFERAVYSERPDNIFKQVLISCALTQKDAFGQFSAKSVASILSEITGERYDVPAFSYHLNEFCAEARGPILKKIGQTRRFTFRFIEALMESYAIMEGMNRKIISQKMVEQNRPKRQPDLFSAASS